MGKLTRVLTVEDQEDTAHLIRAMLERAAGRQFEVTWGSSLQQVLDLCADTTFDAALLDLNLPDSRGVETVKRFHAIQPNLPIVIVSSVDDEDVFYEAMRQGAQDYLVKSELSSELLTRAVLYAISHKKDEDALARSHAAMHRLAAHLQNIREEERARIARNIHDRLGQSLTALRIDQSRLEHHLRRVNSLSAADRVLSRVRDMAELVDDTIRTVREITSELRPGILDDLGLAAALKWEAETFAKRTGMACEVVTSRLAVEVPEPAATQLFRVFQELLTNVARHARASIIAAWLSSDNDSCTMAVEDDGRGITPEQLSNPDSLGILGMRERAEYVGGTITFDTDRAKGTHVEITVPLRLPHA